ncbi:DUF4919 domain-containing protein [Alteraurantiacibacter buctensis]|uniref:Uncharacterized protein n=1 Tax=Alteraurantiacibacter buctensis TaxID=1503981 RepID=A0A844Z054_9SPHN|nr:DUF4919 domain-containing protein [Alteraurantiacibacter buctensis]MXO71333.1 hypothetical protein [Alteraurantiacibacter buctensis]
MPKGRLALGLAVLALCAGTAACVLPPDTPTVIASAAGTSAQDAYRVSSVAQEYEVLRVLGLEARSQALHVINGQPYDVITAFNPRTGETRDVWFDIARFYNRGAF